MAYRFITVGTESPLPGFQAFSRAHANPPYRMIDPAYDGTQPMEFIHAKLAEHYRKWTEKFSRIPRRCDTCVIGAVDLLDIHFSIADYFFENKKIPPEDLHVGPVDEKLFLATLTRQTHDSSTDEPWASDYEKCAALFYGLAQERVFQSFNKRTALIAALYYLARLQQVPTISHKELEIITLIIASNEIQNREGFKPYTQFENGEIRFLARHFQENTRPLEDSDYVITYGELSKKLDAGGIGMGPVHGNLIDVVQMESRPPRFGFMERKPKKTILGSIGFSGWTRQVPEKELAALAKYTNQPPLRLREKSPTILSLINTYSELLQVLAKK